MGEAVQIVFHLVWEPFVRVAGVLYMSEPQVEQLHRDHMMADKDICEVFQRY